MAHNYIYTLTPNPALDLSGHVKDIIPNEKNYVFDERRDPGGNGINAARVAHRLGARAVALGFLGGSAGDEVKKLLDAEGIKTSFVAIRADTRTNVTVTNDSSHKQTRLTFPGPKVSSKEFKALLKNISKLKAPGVLVLGGSLPKGCDFSFYPKIIHAAEKNDLRVIVDAPAVFLREIFLRNKSPLLMIKPNQVELEELVGRKLRNDNQILKAAQSLTKYSEIVCVSLAERGAILVTRSNAWFGKAPKIKARGTVGAGDSMVGAMTTGLVKHVSPAAALDSKMLFDAFALGLAAGAATAESQGTSLADPKRIRQLQRRVKVTSI